MVVMVTMTVVFRLRGGRGRVVSVWWRGGKVYGRTRVLVAPMSMVMLVRKGIIDRVVFVATFPPPMMMTMARRVTRRTLAIVGT